MPDIFVIDTAQSWLSQQYARKDDSGGRWIQLGAKDDGTGQKRGGSPVFIRGGVVERGAPGLVGRKLGSMKEAPTTTHRQELHQQKNYERAQWTKKARQANVDPGHLHQLAAELREHDAAHVADRKKLIQRANKLLRHFGLSASALKTNLRKYGEIPVAHLDQIAETLQSEFPEQFHGRKGDLYDTVLDMLGEDSPRTMTTDEVYQQALLILESEEAGGSELSNEPLFGEDEYEPSEWGGFTPSPETKAVRGAWERYNNREEHAKGGGLFGGSDMQSRAGFAKLPDGAPVLFVEGQHRGMVGKVVRDEQYGNRVAAEINNHPEYGLVPISPESIEPLHAHQSWRSEYAGGPSEQKSLLTADMFLPPRRDASDDVPFARTEAPMNSWNNLSAKALNKRALQFSRAGSSPFEPGSFSAAESLSDATKGSDPMTLDEALAEARRAIRTGEKTEDEAVKSIVLKFGNPASTQANKLFEAALRRSLSGDEPIAATFAQLAQGQAEAPTADERERLRLQRDQRRLQFARAHPGVPFHDGFDYSEQEVKTCSKIASVKKISFTAAVEQYRAGRN